MAGNRGVVYTGSGSVEVQDISYPDLVLREGPGVRKAMSAVSVNMALF